MSFSTLKQSHLDAIAARTTVLVQPAECGALPSGYSPLTRWQLSQPSPGFVQSDLP